PPTADIAALTKKIITLTNSRTNVAEFNHCDKFISCLSSGWPCNAVTTHPICPLQTIPDVGADPLFAIYPGVNQAMFFPFR
ncbi:hypothetical protein, partial [Rothia mucilaginosa]|uniref:hypothetical protein n=1 Tax=Rothia mucilaginosa TaxID=43675 RepID=UPI0026F222A7